MGLSLAVVVALVIAFAALSKGLDRWLVSAAIFFTTTGLVVGSEVLGWVRIDAKNQTVRTLAEATLTLVLFADASRIDLVALRRGAAVPARLLGVGLPLTIVAGALVGLGVLDGLTVVEALVLAIVLAPTDAALGQAVVTDRRLPARIRQGLNVESGLNDGICVPLLFIALGIAEAEAGAMTAARAVQLVVQEIGWGLAAGAAAGLLGAIAVGIAVTRGLGETSWIRVIPAATALLAYGLAATLGGSPFIAAFLAGVVFGVLDPTSSRSEPSLVDEAGEFLNATTFALFGAVLLGPLLRDLTWRSVLYAVLSLTLARMVPVLLAMLGSRAAAATTAYLGWFGPRGLASIVFAINVLETSRLPHLEVILVTVAATVALSVYAHGLTARPLTDRYVRWCGRQAALREMESGGVPEPRWRRPPAAAPGDGEAG